MCGIFAVFGIKGTYDEVRGLAYSLSKRQRHRGPDQSGVVVLVILDDIVSVSF